MHHTKYKYKSKQGSKKEEKAQAIENQVKVNTKHTEKDGKSLMYAHIQRKSKAHTHKCTCRSDPYAYKRMSSNI